MAKKPKTQPKSGETDTQSLQPLLEAMIRLLGRFLFPEDKLREIVMFKKHDPERYIAVYNLCDGERTGKEIANALHLDQGDLSRVLLDWNELGIVYEVAGGGKGKFYKKLYKLEEPKASAAPKESKPETKSTEPPTQPTPSTTQPEAQQPQSQG
jgi:hypothetical protein